MVIGQEYMNETVGQIAAVAATAAICAIFADREDGNGDGHTRCRNVDTGLRPRLG